MEPVLCVDVGSTFTKAVLVDVATGEPVASAAHPTTLPSAPWPRGVLDGVTAVLEKACAAGGVPAGAIDRDRLLVCSSAGGGLRLAVVGYERVVTAEAGHRVALSAGGKVVHVHAGPLDGQGISALRAARPDIVLLVGGTDGGNADVLVHNARRLGAARVPVPVVLAGNADAAAEAEQALASRGRHVTRTANVLPRIGVLEPGPARAAIREAFLAHVIGGKGLAKGRLLGATFAELVRAPTPDVVLAGVGVLADGSGGDVLVVDVGGATTDVYSVVTPTGEDATLRRDVVAPLWRARTVEGDLGMRWSAVGVVEAARGEQLLAGSPEAGEGGEAGGDVEGGDLGDGEAAALLGYARQVAATPSLLPVTAAERDADATLAALAVRVAVRRHARPPTPTAGPRPLREVHLVVGSGGVLRHGGADVRRRILAPLLADHAGGWRVPTDARLAVDEQYVLFAAGLLAAHRPDAAAHLATSRLVPVDA